MQYRVIVTGYGTPLESDPMTIEMAACVRRRMTAKGYLAVVVPVMPRVRS